MMRQVFVVTMPQVEFQPIIAFESETDAAEFARSMHYGGTDAWKQDVHKCVYVPMTYTGLAYSEPIFGDVDELNGGE